MKVRAVAVLVLAGAALIAGGALLRWAAADIDDELRGLVSTTVKGSEVAPALLPVAAAAIAALGAMLASRGVQRRIVGVVIAAIGGVAGWQGVRGLTSTPLDLLVTDPATAGSAAVTRSPVGPVVVILGGLLLLVAGIQLVTGKLASRALGARYERRQSAAETAASAADPALLMWKELDEDRDPTLETDSSTGRETLSEPPVRERPDGKSNL